MHTVPFDSLAESFLKSVVQLNGLQPSAAKDEVLVNCISRNFETDEPESAVYQVELPSGLTHKLTDGSLIAGFSDKRRALIEHDSRVFLYDRYTKKKEYLFDIETGFYFTGHLSDYGIALSPDEKKIAFLKPVQAAGLPVKEGVLEIENLLYKTKGGRDRPLFWDGRYNQLRVFDLETHSQYPLTWKDRDVHSFSWSPDSASLCFITNLTSLPDCNHRNSLCIVSCVSGEITVLIDGEGSCYQPAWSPAGNAIAYLHTGSEQTSKDSSLEDTKLRLIDLDTRQIARLSEDLDRKAELIKWAPDGKGLYFLYGDHGRSAVCFVASDGSKKAVFSGERIISDFAVAGEDHELFMISSDLQVPDEIYRFKPGSDTLERISIFNREATRRFPLSRHEEVRLSGDDGLELQGWVLFPGGWEAGKKYPLALVIHGGPHNMFGYEFNEKIKFLSLCGFAVFFMNPRGSTGYGQSFTQGTYRDWGGGDFRDLMQGMAHVLSQYSWIDADKLGVYGQSYGGYMTNWIITQTGMFGAAVSEGGIGNLVSFSGQSLFHLLTEAEFGRPWENFDLLWSRSPLQYCSSVSTPTLFLHGQKDNEVPVEQSDEMYAMLYKLGIKTRMVRFLEEGHGWRPDLRPRNQVRVLTELYVWFHKHLS